MVIKINRYKDKHTFMDIPDIILELMKHLHTIDMLRFCRSCKRNYKLLDTFISNINEEEFFDSNNISILSRSYELYYKLPLCFPMPQCIKYNCKTKKEYIKCVIDNINIKIYTNRMKVSGIKSRFEMINIINKFFEQKFTKYNLIPISTSLTFNKSLIHSGYKGIRVNNCHSHLTADILEFNSYKGHISYISSRRKIDVLYNEFKIFYLTYTSFVS